MACIIKDLPGYTVFCGLTIPYAFIIMILTHFMGAAFRITIPVFGEEADRLFYSAAEKLEFKPAACIVSCRRGGATASFDVINKYFSINNMPIVTSQYWNQVHGNTPDEVRQDAEGLQTMRTLARNMAWMLNCIEAGKARGLNHPELEPWQNTNFIR